MRPGSLKLTIARYLSGQTRGPLEPWVERVRGLTSGARVSVRLRRSYIPALVIWFSVGAESKAQVGLGTHPLEHAFRGPLGFSLAGPDSLTAGKHLQVLPSSLRSKEGTGAPSGFGVEGGLALDYYSRAQVSLEDALKRLVRDQIGSLMGIQTKRSEENGSVLLSFHLGGVKLCAFGVRGAAFLGREIVLQGHAPLVRDLPSPVDLDDWPDRDQTVGQVVEALERSMGGSVTVQDDSFRCYAASQGILKPAWHVSLDVRGYPYAVFADTDQVFSIEPAFFHVAGRARVYPKDAVSTPTLTTVELSDLRGDGTLTNAYFKTVASLERARAYSPSSEFFFDVNTPEFKETSVFVNATRHFNFLQGLGFGWYGPRPLELDPLCAVCGGNNAMFIAPQTATDLPSIKIGLEQKVDGKEILRNLATDAGVLSHELGHFVAFRTITATRGESLVLHEALADYFEAARSEDPCLGESICPEGSSACIERGRCLRTSKNDFKFNDSHWQAFFNSSKEYNHLHGQVFSGLLWDLRKDAKGGAKKIDTLVMRSIGFLPPEAGFSDFLIQLVVTDKDINQGQHFDQIAALVKERNLEFFLTLDASGNPTVPVVRKSGQTEADSPGVAGESPRRREKSKGCGVIGTQEGGDHRAGVGFGPLFIIAFPFSIVLLFIRLKSFKIN